MTDHIAEKLPVTAPDSEDWIDTPDVRSHEPSAMQAFFIWEKLRILFNAIYACGLCYILSRLRGNGQPLAELLLAMALFNAVFSLGPVAEGYLCWFGAPRVLARWIAALAVNMVCLTIVAASLM